MAVQEKNGNSQEELWKKIPLEIQFEIDSAIERGEKPLAVNHLMCANVGFNLMSAKTFIEERKKVLPKRIPKKEI